MSRPSASRWAWNALLVLSLAIVVALLAPPVRAGDQLRVDVNEPFEVDGEVFDPATLTLRHVHDLNPTSALHVVWVDGKCLGLVVARQADAEGVASDNSMLFLRNGDNRLVLVGMTQRGEPAVSFHRVGESLAAHRPSGSAGPLLATTSN